MRSRNLMTRVRACVLVIGLALAPLAATALAQNSSQSNSSTTTTQSSQPSTTTSGSSQSTRSTTTTTTATQPVQTTVRETSRQTGIDPIWLIIGAIALVAIILIVALSARGRSRSADRVEVVHERETVIRKD